MATPAHPFGYGRERYFWSFVVSMVLFSLGSLFAVYEGIEKLRHPHELESLGWAIGILVFAIALETYSFRTAIIESRPHKGTSSWWQFVRRAKMPELPVVLLEDLGALIGLVIALVAVTLSAVTDEPMWDGAGTLCIGILLGIIAIILAVEMKSLLLGESGSPEDITAIEAAITGSDDVGAAHPHAHPAHRPRRAVGGRQDRVHRHPRRRRPRHPGQRHRGPHPRRRSPPQG